MAKHLMRPSDRATYPAGADQYAPEILAAWLRAFPDAQPIGRDKEDWVENACFIEAFERLGVDYKLLDSAKQGWISSASDHVAEGDGPEAFFHTGIARMDQSEDVGFQLVLQRPASLKKINYHAQSSTFAKYAGRPMELVQPDGEAMSAAIRRIVPESGNVFIKTVQKDFAKVFTIEAGTDAWRQVCEQNEGAMWATVQFEGMEAPFFSVQGCIEPAYEYRMFMVAGKPVTGAGCVEAFTPLDNRELFDPKMEPLRNRSEVQTRPEIVDKYIAFAQKFGGEFQTETGVPMAYSLDLCINEITGEVTPIELNPPMNLGRYASSVDAWVSAVDDAMSSLVGAS